MLNYQKEISITEVIKRSSLSPKNYLSIDIDNPSKNSLLSFLSSETPFVQGEEPGSYTYVQTSNISFLRNSCIDANNFSNQLNKEISLNPRYDYAHNIESGDILLCKDANIGESCYFIPSTNQRYVLSSGIVKLNFCDELEKFYCLAFIRDSYFQSQLDSLTPRGSTIRHAGNKFLACQIPAIGTKEEKILELIKSLTLNIAYSERLSDERQKKANRIFHENFLYSVPYDHNDPTFCTLSNNLRVDAGYYSKIVGTVHNAIKSYKYGFDSLNGLGFTLRRGPNLAKRDLGRSLKSDDFKKGYHLLVYPSDISDSGYLLKQVYLGARNPVWYMKNGDILFSAEGTVGKVFIICDETMKFTTNFHGIIISPTKNIPVIDSVVLGQFLHFLKSVGYFDMVSVGGQGGSFAVGYWEDFMIPLFSDNFKNKIASLYHNSTISISPLIHDPESLQKAGIFELNQFRIACKELIKSIVKDIKCNTTKSPEHYSAMSLQIWR